MDKKFDKFDREDFDYTIVMDPRFPGMIPERPAPAAETAAPAKEPAAAGTGAPVKDPAAAVEVSKPTKDAEPEKPVIDPWERLYSEYEEMCLKEPTILDLDDAYPHSYQWRVGDRYDPAKIEVLKAALMEGKRISDTEAYQEYLEDFKRRRFEPVSWE
ncbi:MAG: hypothetical protein E7227_06290 [Clostridiales bacterium]|nr:hypothetical protein [Clostridiales bacterium]